MTQDVPLADLYREVILDHYKSPRNRGQVDGATLANDGVNPSCGDELHLSARLDEGRVAAIAFAGRGCAISQASASMMMETVEGKSATEARALALRVNAALKGDAGSAMPEENADLEALEGVRKYPVRIKCALLAWETLLQGLQGRTSVTTEEE